MKSNEDRIKNHKLNDVTYNVEIRNVTLDGRKAVVIWDLVNLNPEFLGRRISVIDSLEGENALQFLKNCEAIGLPTTPLGSYESLEDAIGRKTSLHIKKGRKTNSDGSRLYQVQSVFMPLSQSENQFSDFRMVS